MQAIVSDIIVSQAAQSGILQVSQPLNNNSSLELTFAQMLESQKAEQTDEAKTPENAKEDSKVEQPDVEKPVKTASFDEEGTAGEKALEKVPQAKKAAEKNQVKNQTEEKEIPQVKDQINKKTQRRPPRRDVGSFPDICGRKTDVGSARTGEGGGQNAGRNVCGKADERGEDRQLSGRHGEDPSADGQPLVVLRSRCGNGLYRQQAARTRREDRRRDDASL